MQGHAARFLRCFQPNVPICLRSRQRIRLPSLRAAANFAIAARRGSYAACLLTLLLACDSTSAKYQGDRIPVRVMTRNLYLGADVSSVLLEPKAELIPALAGAFWGEVLRSDFPLRAKLLADEIVTANPDLIGLQEVELYRRQAPSDFATTQEVNATEVVLDFLALLQTELAARGATYVIASENALSDVEVPTALAEGLVDLRMTDQDVILVKPGITFSQPVNATFTKLPTTQLGGTGPRVQIKRGYATIQVTFPHAVGNAGFVFGNSHLEVGQDLLRVFQESQADELVKSLRHVSGAVILVGDFNSPADRKGTRSYGLLRELFDDTYADLKPGEPGYTCCIDIYAGGSGAARSRIDLVLTRGDIKPLDASVVGAERKTASGVLASDHLGVVTTLSLVPDSAR